MSDEVKTKPKADRVPKAKPDPLDLGLLPDTAPFLSVRDLAILWRMTPAAINKAMETEGDALGKILRDCLLPEKVSPHRKLFDRRRVDAEIQKLLPPPAESA